MLRPVMLLPGVAYLRKRARAILLIGVVRAVSARVAIIDALE